MQIRSRAKSARANSVHAEPSAEGGIDGEERDAVDDSDDQGVHEEELLVDQPGPRVAQCLADRSTSSGPSRFGGRVWTPWYTAGHDSETVERHSRGAASCPLPDGARAHSSDRPAVGVTTTTAPPASARRRPRCRPVRRRSAGRRPSWSTWTTAACSTRRTPTRGGRSRRPPRS